MNALTSRIPYGAHVIFIFTLEFAALVLVYADTLQALLFNR